MHSVEVFDPAMCCPTGVCGPSVDPEVLRIAGLLEALDAAGFDVTRHNLSSEPQAFVQNAEVAAMLKEKGVDALPVTYVDGKMLRSGAYPSNDELGDALGVTFVEQAPASGCCCGSDGDADGGCCCGSDSNAADSSADGGCCCGSGCC